MDVTSLAKLEGLLEQLLSRLEASLMTPGPAPKSYPIDGAAKALSVSQATIRRMVGRGELRTVRLGKRLVVPASEIDRLLAPKVKPSRSKTAPPAASPRDRIRALTKR